MVSDPEAKPTVFVGDVAACGSGLGSVAVRAVLKATREGVVKSEATPPYNTAVDN
jgi:hypothetical protein